jgi:steroid delta-isomerase-like uncharacterized protein
MTTSGDVRSLVRRYIDRVWNDADFVAFEALTQPHFLYRLGSQPPRERAAMKQFLQATHVAFPDWHVDIDDLIVEGQLAAARWHGQMTHNGPFRGQAPTGRRISLSGTNVYRIEDGRIAAEWEQMDSLGMLQQLGLLPPA